MINVMAHPEYANLDLFDPQVNLNVAYQIFKNQGWYAWKNCSKNLGFI